MRFALTQDFDNERRVMNIIQLTKQLGLASTVHQATLRQDDGASTSEIIRKLMDGETLHNSYYWKHNASAAFKESATILAKALLADGFTALGHGHFSIALEHPATPNVVYKVSFRADDAYSHYALWCRMNPHENAPTMLRIERHGDWHIYAMPKYDRLKPSENKWPIYYAIRKYADHDEYGIDPAERDLIPRSLRMFVIKMRDYFHNVCPLDLHDENLMMCRATGNIIITDPVSFNTRRNPEHELQLRTQLEATYCDKVAA